MKYIGQRNFRETRGKKVWGMSTGFAESKETQSQEAKGWKSMIAILGHKLRKAYDAIPRQKNDANSSSSSLLWASHLLAQLIHTNAPWRWCCNYHPPLTYWWGNRGIEKLNCAQGHTANKPQSWETDPGHLAPEAATTKCLSQSLWQVHDNIYGGGFKCYQLTKKHTD